MAFLFGPRHDFVRRYGAKLLRASSFSNSELHRQRLAWTKVHNSCDAILGTRESDFFLKGNAYISTAATFGGAALALFFPEWSIAGTSTSIAGVSSATITPLYGYIRYGN